MKKFITLFSLLILGLTTTFANQDSISQNTDVVNELSYDLSKDVFKNVAVKAGAGSATVSWALDYESIEFLKENNYSIIVKYITKIGEK